VILECIGYNSGKVAQYTQQTYVGVRLWLWLGLVGLGLGLG